MKPLLPLACCALTLVAARADAPVPTPAQLAWQEAEFGVLFHFDPRIYNGERGYQSLQPACRTPLKDPDAYANRFNPAKLDTEQWVTAAAAAGARFAILVVKHETGFCLWQSDANPFSLKHIPWRDGQADILRDFVTSCRRHGLKPGVFTEARWDLRLGVHNFQVGAKSPVTQAEYNRLVEREVEELCTRYGELFELWFDGGVRSPDKDGPDVLPLAARHQPNMLFYHSDQRRDARWGGTESGTVGYPCWSTIDLARIKTGTFDPNYLAHGDPAAPHWCPAMADAPLRCERGRHDWIWQAGGEPAVASLAHLQRMYCDSVGRNSTLILGLTPDRDGLVPEPDVARLREFGAWLEQAFGGPPLARTAGEGLEFVLELPAAAGSATTVVLQEDLRGGERVRDYLVEAELDGAWQTVGRGTCIGQKRIERLKPTAARRFRLRVLRAEGVPRLRAFCVRGG